MSPGSTFTGPPGSQAAVPPATVVLDGGGNPRNHTWTAGPPGNSYGGNQAQAIQSRQLTISASIIGSVLPVCYGEREILAAGQWWLWYRGSDASWYAYCAMALSEGELGSIGDVDLNGHDIDDLVGFGSETYVQSYDKVTGADTETISPSLSSVPGLVETWPGLARVDMRLDTKPDSPIPGQMRLTAKITGRKIKDFRFPLAPAAATSNLVVIAYDLLTNTEFGLGVDPALINVTSWTDAANHCDSLAADLTKRYEFNGLLYERNLMRAINTILGHGMMSMSYDPAAGTYYIATSRADLTSVATIEKSDWKSHAKWFEIPLPERPNQIVVNYTQGDTFRPASVTIEDPAGIAAGDIRRVEIPLPGCYSASFAQRFGIKRYNESFLQRYRWFGDVGPVIADVLIGQVVTINTRTLSGQLVRLKTKKQVTQDLYRCEFEEFDPTTDSLAIATDDTPPSVSVLPPVPPTANTKIFGEAGDWDLLNLLPDPDDLTTAQGWALLAGTTAVYNAVDKHTEFTAAIGTGLSGGSFNVGIPTGNAYTLIIVAKTSDPEWEFQYDGLAAQVEGGTDIVSDGEWHRYEFKIQPTAFSDQKVLLYGKRSTAARSIQVRRARCHPLVFNSSLYLYERDQWVEAGGAPTTVESYFAVDRVGRQVEAVPVGSSEMEVTQISLGSVRPISPSYFDSFPSAPLDLTLSALGPSGLTAPFPTPTIEIEARTFQGQVERQADVDTTGRLPETDFVWDGTSHVYRERIGSITGWPTGVEDAFRANTDLLFMDPTREFTLDVTADVEYWIEQKKYTLASGADPSIVLPGTEGTYRVYLKTDGTLGYSTTFDVDVLLKENAYLTSIYLAVNESGFGSVFYDFESDTVGSVPAGWSFLQRSGGSGTATVAFASGNHYFYFVAGGSYALEYMNDDVPLTNADMQIRGEFSIGSSGAGCVPYLRHDGGTATVNCYYAAFYNTGIFLGEKTAGVNAGIGSAAKTFTPGVTYEFLFECVGTTVRCRVWTGTEPTTWDVSVTDTSHSTGGAMLSTYLDGKFDNIMITGDSIPAGFVHLTMLDERHDLMNPLTHAYLHDRFSAYIKSGYAIGDIIDDGSGDLDSHAEFSIENGVIVDEDLPHSTAAILTSGDKPLFYLDGATPVLRRADIDNVPIYKPATGLAYWNSFSAGSWGLTSVTQNDFMHVWILATNNHPDEPGGGIACVMGQAEYNTVSAARAGAPTELASIVSILSLEESAFIGGILYQCGTGYSNTWGARVRPDADGNPYWDLRQSEIGSGAPPGDHGALTGRSSPSQHPDTALDLSTVPSGLLAGAATVDDAMVILDGVPSRPVVTSKTTTFIFGNVEEWAMCDATTGAYSGTLPTAVGRAGYIMRLTKVDSSGNAATMAANGTETIDGVASLSATAQWQTITAVSDGANWVTE